MAQDKWANHRIIYWQAIYEKLLKKYHQKGMYLVRNRDAEPHDPICVAIGRKVREAREEAGLSQKELADRAGFCQQFISRIERGKENISLITLKKISKPFGKEAEVNFV
jgi:DNA-binding XRE family transcriptional regulator